MSSQPDRNRTNSAAFNRRRFLTLAACGAAGVTARSLAAAAARPNFILLLSDDQSWNGLSTPMHPTIAGSKSDFYRTPNLAKLAAKGMRFSDAYAPAPVCSPTRLSLQTGKSPAQTRMTKAAPVVSGPAYRMVPATNIRHIRADQTTIAMILRRAGYATAHYGKWHLGSGGPGKFGYDEHDGDTGNKDAAPFVDPNPVDIFGISKRTVAFMEKNVKAGKPFFAQLSHHALHYSENARKATVAACEKRPKGRTHHNVQAAAITEDLDAGVGVVLDAIDQLGIADRTYVIYMSDNGGGGGSSNRPLSGGKGSLLEGGIRVPLIVRGPGVKAGTFCDVPVVGHDLFPTFCELAGAKEPLPKGVEGGSIAVLLAGGGTGAVKRPREGLTFHFPHYQGRDFGPHSVIRLGRYKLIKLHETNDVRLFDLADDIGERRDLSKQMPDKAAELTRRLDAYLEEIGAGMPKPNPHYDPTQSPPTKPRRGDKPTKAGRGRGGKKGDRRKPRQQ